MGIEQVGFFRLSKLTIGSFLLPSYRVAFSEKIKAFLL